MSNRDWSDEDDALLRSYAAARLSARTAGHALGITRNAVLGRAHRIGVKFDAPHVVTRAGTTESAHKAWDTRRERYGEAGRP